MDCHSCEFLSYAGCRYGRCTHSGHRDVVLAKGDGRPGHRSYNKQVCKDFAKKKRCSNCMYWKRGKYFADGKTPAERGRCSLDLEELGRNCIMWKQGRTSGSRRR